MSFIIINLKVQRRKLKIMKYFCINFSEVRELIYQDFAKVHLCLKPTII